MKRVLDTFDPISSYRACRGTDLERCPKRQEVELKLGLFASYTARSRLAGPLVECSDDLIHIGRHTLALQHNGQNYFFCLYVNC